MKRRPVSRAPRSVCGTRAAWEGKSGTGHVFPGFLGFRQGAVSDLQTGMVQTTNDDLDFPCIGITVTVQSSTVSVIEARSPAET
jgi:hypothetical protein